MTLLASFGAVHYRGIDGLSLPRLSHANLVTGVNGIGKTALLEAIWLFTGRYNPMLLWNANVQRSANPVLDPVARLSGGKLELHGVENGTNHQLRYIFEKVADVTRPAAIGNAPEQNLAQLPVAGRIDTYLDGELASGHIGGMQPTPWGIVTHENPVPPVTRPHCVIEGTKFQLDTSGEYLHRYSDMVRENRKGELTNAINLILPKVKSVEILTDKMGVSYLSAVTTDGVQLPLHDLGGGGRPAVSTAAELLHRSRRPSARGRDGKRHSSFRVERSLAFHPPVDARMERTIRGNDPQRRVHRGRNDGVCGRTGGLVHTQTLQE